MTTHEQSPTRRFGETFEFKLAGRGYIDTLGRFPDRRVGDLYLNDHKSNSAANPNTRDSPVVCLTALQCGWGTETIRETLCRNSRGRRSCPWPAVLDQLAATGS
jgi:hypothetical protein